MKNLTVFSEVDHPNSPKEITASSLVYLQPTSVDSLELPDPTNNQSSVSSHSIPVSTSPGLASPAPKSVEVFEDCSLDGSPEEDDLDLEEEEEEEVYMNCICNNNDTCDILSVMCTFCGEGFHAQCCGLDEEVSQSF